MTEEVIKTFLTKMATQDNRSTAHPFFYVIRTKVEDHAPIENCDRTRFYWQDSSYDSLDEISGYCKKMDYSDIETQQAIAEAQEYGIKDRWVNRGMFLTEDDAESHLKLNHYHYSPDAHSYVEHAWRAPELSGFFKALFEYFNIEVKK